MRFSPHLLLASFLAVLSGCSTLASPSGTKGRAEVSPGQTYRQPMDDRRFLKDLETSFNQLVTDGKLTPSADLASQVTRTKAKVRTVLSPAASPTRSGSEIYSQNAPGSLFFLNTFLCDKCHLWHIRPAGAWVLSGDGVIVTNQHVLEAGLAKSGEKPSPGMAVADSSGKIYPVREILAVSKADDFALLRVEGEGLRTLQVATGAAAGDPVFVLSSPQQRLHSLTTGIVSRYFVERQPGARPVTRLAITADYATGSSGSPVFNAQGAVIGMVSSTSSLAAEPNQEKRDTHQMVVKNCVPVEAILGAAEGP